MSSDRAHPFPRSTQSGDYANRSVSRISSPGSKAIDPDQEIADPVPVVVYEHALVGIPREIEGGQVLALEEVIEVARGEEEAVGCAMHQVRGSLTIVGAILLTRVGASSLTIVGAMELTLVGAMGLTMVGAMRPTLVGAIRLTLVVPTSSDCSGRRGPRPEDHRVFGSRRAGPLRVSRAALDGLAAGDPAVQWALSDR